MIKKIIKKALNDRKRGRNSEIYNDDIMIVSYPKSGNTWMRFLLGNILYDDLNFANMENLIPDLYVVSNKDLQNFKRPRIIKSHEYFDPRYKKIIYIVRDPRSIAVSYYYHSIKMNNISNDMNFSEFLDLFLDGEVDSFASWDENFKSWNCTKAENSNEFLLVKYEDLISNTFGEMQKVLIFLNITKEDNVISKGIEKSSFSSMKKNENKNKNKTKVLKKSNKNMPFVRAGKTDEWIEYFGDNELSKIQNIFGDTMTELGYV